MLPKDAITYVTEISGIGSSTITTSFPTTILNINIKQSGISSDSLVFCGGTNLAKNYAEDYRSGNISYICNGTLGISKTGVGDDAFFSITYVPRNIASSTEANFLQGFAGGFTYGEAVISVFVFLIFIVSLYDLFNRFLRK